MKENARPWIVSMLGSREHYAAPRALQQSGLLQRFYTDLWLQEGRSLLVRLPRPLRRIAARYHPELPSEKVVAFNMPAFFDLARLEYFKHVGHEKRCHFFLAEGKRFAQRVATDMQREGLDRRSGVFFGFTAAALETMQVLKGGPILTVLDQYDAGEEHASVLSAEHELWPGWESSSPKVPDAMRQRWEEERRLADVVFVNSEWTRKAMLKRGVPPEKLVVGPLAYEGSSSVEPKQTPKSQAKPLQVLWVASVTLGKGIQYLIEAAKGLDESRFQFTIAGSIGISKRGLDAAPTNMRFLGLVPQVDIVGLYQAADVYVLPTLSDGFAATQLEAMANGLPVITTGNCGDVVTHGVDGLIVEARDALGLRQALVRLERDREEIVSMGRAALETVKRFSLQNYTERLVNGVNSAILARQASADRPHS